MREQTFLDWPSSRLGRKLRVNPRTLERWEQGRSKPNDQAAALILLVRRFPDTLERLDLIGTRGSRRAA